MQKRGGRRTDGRETSNSKLFLNGLAANSFDNPAYCAIMLDIQFLRDVVVAVALQAHFKHLPFIRPQTRQEVF
jgi:hypothetical protein